MQLLMWLGFSASFAVGLIIPFGSLGSARAERLEAVRGVILAEADVTISSELVARVQRLPFKPGEAFAAGETLIEFDCKRYAAELRAADAEVHSARITVKTDRQLLKRRAAGANELALSQAKLDRATASAEALAERNGQCTITAPFDGHVVERMIDAFEMPQANAPLIRIVKSGKLEIDLFVPSKWLVWLERGHEFTFRIDETQTAYTAKVSRLAAVVDPISRTARVYAELVDPSATVLPGMSGSAHFNLPKR